MQERLLRKEMLSLILKKIIKNKINKPINPGNKKILIFSAFADTAVYLYENLSKWIKKEFILNAALVTGSGENKCTLKGIKIKDLNSILTNFSPISKERNKQNKVIQLVNFWPNMELDEYINLEARVTGRMVLLDVSATGEENIILHFFKMKPT